jgi:tetratricopeptide (TPR) repeat protein
MSRVILPALLITGIGLTGCGDDDEVTDAKLTPGQIVDQGWSFFARGDYAAAKAEFDAALGEDGQLSDAWNGLGWTLGRMPGQIGQAGAKFSRALQLDTTRYDALGGWAFVAYQQGDWPGAIRKADSLLYRRPGWRFLHESRLDKYDLRLLQAASHYNLNEFTTSFQIVVDYLNPLFEANVSTATGRRELLDEIERLRRVYG